MDKVPRLKIPQQTALDIFTRIDEELAQLINGMNIIIDLLRSIDSKIAQVGAPYIPPPNITPTPPGEHPPVIPPPEIPPPSPVHPVPVSVVSIPAGSKLVYTDSISVSTSNWYELDMDTDMVVIVSSDDILVSPREDQPGFLVQGGVYFALNRSKDFKTLYIKAANTNTTVWIAGLEIEGR